MCLHAEHVNPDVAVFTTENLYHDLYPHPRQTKAHTHINSCGGGGGGKMIVSLVTKGPDFRP